MTSYATGGMVFTQNDFTYHVFTYSSSFVLARDVLADFLIVGGGGSGGSGRGGGGGGGAAYWGQKGGSGIVIIRYCDLKNYLNNRRDRFRKLGISVG
jgi:hypothetical protein